MRRKHLVMLGLLSGLVSCVDVQMKPSISINAVPGVNFSAYRTYAWGAILKPTRLTIRPVTYERVISDFETTLASKGYHKVDAADLSLNLTIGAQEETQSVDLGNYGGLATLRFIRGPISLDVYDTKTQKAVWQGQVIQTFDRDNPNPDVDSAINKLMKQFPATAAVPVR